VPALGEIALTVELISIAALAQGAHHLSKKEGIMLECLQYDLSVQCTIIPAAV
jgi:hypothetical protein